MSLSWNEVRDRAIKFTRQWAGETSERAEAKTFWDEFFDVFGLQRRTVASFEEPVRNLKGQYNFIDLFWRGVLLGEHKSLGQNLGKAESQAFCYIQDLARDGRTNEIPRYVILSDFARIVLHDLEPDDPEGLPSFGQWQVRTIEFPLADLHKHIREFAFIKGEKTVRLDPEDPANFKAAEMMANLHDTLKAGGYAGHDLERFLVRILFCLFADDTGIFDEPHIFQNYIKANTREDGIDLGIQLAQIFEVLDTPSQKRQKNLDEDLALFPYVNGGLFQERLPFAQFNRDMRNALLACCAFNWSKISPAVFGSLFQSVMDPKERRQSGGHYTSERDIMKVIRSLFLDDLKAEFAQIQADKSSRRKARLEDFHKKLAGLRFFDPACGCGNFLVITYRELRLLEIEVLKTIHGGQQVTDIQHLSRLDVDQMYGIEISEWPVRIAEVALWLLDHQMNQALSEAFGQYYVRLPLRATPHIVCGNALRLDWKDVIPPEKCSYILGNPPFIGHHLQTPEQKADQMAVLANIQACGVLDYVSNWYIKAADYLANRPISAAFVSTNSIIQGEQVGLLWSELFFRYHVKIHFAHRPFKWESEARGKAHVHVVIIGFGPFDILNKKIFDYDADPENPTLQVVRNISPYLIEGNDMVLSNRNLPVSDVPVMSYGNKPTDGGFLILDDEEKQILIQEEPQSEKLIRPYIGAQELLDGTSRWCLWLVGIEPAELRHCPQVVKRVESVKQFRLKSKASTTRAYANFPTLFRQIAQPESNFIAIPAHTSESRKYIPFAYYAPSWIVSNACFFIPNTTAYHFGVISSEMHMAWVRQVCGRLESRYRYSKDIVYNNFPWPQAVTEKQKTVVESAAQKVLDVRKEFPSSTLADLYDPVAMPPKLVKAHAELDRAVDRCYRAEAFPSDRHRVEFLFAQYEQLTAPLVAKSKPKRRAILKAPTL
ncbi:MAG: DNA methyltransferase [bacterium]